MIDPWSALGPILGGGGFLAALAGLLLFVTRKAIATAVEQAGRREIERLKGELEAERDKQKHTFATELERERHDAATALEQFKTQLTFEAEVRRHAAAKKVAALLTMAEVMRASVESIYTLGTDDALGRQAAINRYGAALREGLVFFRPEVVTNIEALRRELVNGHVARSRGDRGAPDLADVVNRGEAARDKLLEALRRELQLVETRETAGDNGKR